MTEAATRHRHTPGTPCWASLMVHGLSASQDFYRELLGWEFRPGPRQPGPYVRAFVGGQEVAGLGELTAESGVRPTAWLPYLASDDADTSAALIRDYGGTVAVGPLEVRRAGRLVIASDPVGASFGVWQHTPPAGAGAPSPEGPGGPDAPGVPLWYELVTRDASSVGAFYSAVFGYETRPAEAGRLTLHLDGRPVAGMQGVGRELPRDRGPYWETYFSVEDPDAVAGQAKHLGGHVVRGPLDSPWGRLAQLADPEGAQFSVLRADARTG